MRGTGAEMRLLLVTSGKDGEKWTVPGGGIEKGETAEAAAVRELIEEAGVRTDSGAFLGVFENDTRRHRTHVFVCAEREEFDEWDDGKFGRRRCWMPFAEVFAKVKESQGPILKAVFTHYGLPLPHPG